MQPPCYSDYMTQQDSPYKNHVFYGILIATSAKILFDIAKPCLKKCVGKAISRGIDIYIDLKWKYRSKFTESFSLQNVEKVKGISVAKWIDKTSDYGDYGVYIADNKKYISFNLQKDMSEIIIDNETQIENIKIYNGDKEETDQLKLSVALDIVTACSGPDAMFQCGVPSLNQVRSLDYNNLLEDATKIIVNLTNYEEFKIEN